MLVFSRILLVVPSKPGAVHYYGEDLAAYVSRAHVTVMPITKHLQAIPLVRFDNVALHVRPQRTVQLARQGVFDVDGDDLPVALIVVNQAQQPQRLHSAGMERE